MRNSVRNQVAVRGWFRKVPSAAGTRSFGLAVIAIALIFTLALGLDRVSPELPKALLLLIPVCRSSSPLL